MQTTTLLSLGIVLSLLAGCGEDVPAHRPTSRPQDWPSEAARRLEPDHAPTPFTAEQIRQGCPPGLRSTYLTTSGGKSVTQVWEFRDPDETSVEFSMTRLDGNGKPTGEPRKSRIDWTSLQHHADYPAKYTTIRDEELTVPAGTFLCMHYTVREPDEGKISVGDFWFAYEHPGAPIKWIQSADGVTLMELELQEREVVLLPSK